MVGISVEKARKAFQIVSTQYYASLGLDLADASLRGEMNGTYVLNNTYAMEPVARRQISPCQSQLTPEAGPYRGGAAAETTY